MNSCLLSTRSQFSTVTKMRKYQKSIFIKPRDKGNKKSFGLTHYPIGYVCLRAATLSTNCRWQGIPIRCALESRTSNRPRGCIRCGPCHRARSCCGAARQLDDFSDELYAEDDYGTPIEDLIPDYSILEQIDYKYPVSDAYSTYASRGCTRAWRAF